jgi:hypothetical protein
MNDAILTFQKLAEASPEQGKSRWLYLKASADHHLKE